MSSRTAERAKAVRKAWEREQQLVSSGEGTRDWTPVQQQSILDIGVALDDDGKPFEGQHMKSVVAYPEYAGDPNNIQFLTRQEHLEAHDGNWQNQTNWYYDPVSKEKHIFGDDLEPCEIIELSDPIRSPVTENISSEENMDSTDEVVGQDAPEQSTDSPPLRGENTTRTNSSSQDVSPQPSVDTKSSSSTVKKSFWEKLADVGSVVKNFSQNHPVITGLIKVGGAAAATYVVGKAASGGGGSSQSSNDFDASDNDDNNSDYYSSSDVPSSSDDSDSLSDDTDVSGERDYPEERSSPREHIVPGHGQHYHTKDGVIWKEKDPYPRGGNKDE